MGDLGRQHLHRVWVYTYIHIHIHLKQTENILTSIKHKYIYNRVVRVLASIFSMMKYVSVYGHLLAPHVESWLHSGFLSGEY
jgi:hypothetical protein